MEAVAEQQPRVLNPLITFLVPVKYGEFYVSHNIQEMFWSFSFSSCTETYGKGKSMEVGQKEHE